MPINLDARLILSKLAFGPSPGDLKLIGTQGVEAWLRAQLLPPPDDGCARQIADAKWRLKYQYTKVKDQPPETIDEDRTLETLAKPIEDQWQIVDRNLPGQERSYLRTAVAMATILRAVHSPWQLREVMADFWHNHFNVNAYGDQLVAVALPSYDAQAIRPHALGNFRAMLEAVASSAAMLVYLNNRSSRGGAANENFARELFELHTLGRPAYLNALYARWRDVPGALEGKPVGYIDQDVYEAARAFTGWSIEDKAGIGGGKTLPNTGRFAYVETWHDNYQKRILAAEFEPYQAPKSDGQRVLDLVATHPATARYVCTKLCARFVTDTPPPALVEATAKVWTENASKPDQIARVIETIVRSPAFAKSSGTKVKRPLELAASFARAAALPLVVTPGVLNELDNSGQRLFGWGPPTGHPDESGYWLSSNAVRRRWSLLFGLADNSWGAGLSPQVASIAAQPTPEAAVTLAHQVLLGTKPSPSTTAAILDGMELKPADPFATRKDAGTLAKRLLAYAAMTPEFQTR